MFEDIVPGLTIRIHQKIQDVNSKGEEKERIQIYEGIVIARHGKKDDHSTITVRKISNGVGVEKIFPLNLPAIAKIERVKKFTPVRSKLFFLRTYKKKLKEVAIKAQ